MQEQIAKIEIEETILAQKSTKPTEEKVASEFLQAYAQEMKRVKQLCQQKIVDFKEISYKEGNFSPFQCSILRQFNNFESVIFEVKMGAFTLNIKVLNIDKKSPLSSCPEVGRGKFGKVNVLNFKDKEVALKSCEFQCISNEKAKYFQKQQQESGSRSEGKLKASIRRTIFETIRQYSLMKIVDSIGSGIKVQHPFGFDLIVFEDCAQFAMEKCDHIERYSDKDYDYLLQSLGRMHSYNIVHRDLNPNNIMFSSLSKRPVFVDFGFSNILQQHCGQKSWTFFQGTLNYVSAEMSQLLYSKEEYGFIDLYYNDLFGLMKTNKELEEQLKKNDLQGQHNLRNNLNIGLLSEYFNPNKNEAVLEYYLILLKHEGLFNQLSIKTLLQEELHIYAGNLGQRTLATLMQLTLQSDLLKQILVSQLKNLNNLDEYHRLAAKVSYKHQAVKYYLVNSPDVDGQRYGLRQPGDKNKFSQRYQIQDNYQIMANSKTQFFSLQNQQRNTIEIIYQQIIKKAIFEKMKDQHRQEYYSLLFDCIRFDHKNLKIEQKNTLISLFLDFIKQTSNKGGENEQFQICFKHLLTYCFWQSSKQWHNRHRFYFLFQAILTDISFISQLQLIDKQIALGRLQFDQCFTLWYEHFLLARIFEFKIKFQNKKVAFGEIVKINQNYDKLSSVLVSFEDQKDSDRVAIRQIVEITRGEISDLENSSVKTQNLVNSFLSSNLKNKLIIVLSHWIIESARKAESLILLYETLANLNNKIKNMLIVNTLTFSQKLVLNNILELLTTAQEKTLLMSQIKGIVNSPILFESLIFRELFLRDQLRNSNRKTVAKARQQYLSFFEDLSQACFEDKRMNLYQKYLSQCLVFILRQKMDSVQVMTNFGRRYLTFLQEQKYNQNSRLQRYERQVFQIHLLQSKNFPVEVQKALKSTSTLNIFDILERRVIDEQEWSVNDLNYCSLFSYLQSSEQINCCFVNETKKFIRIFADKMLSDTARVLYFLSFIVLNYYETLRKQIIGEDVYFLKKEQSTSNFLQTLIRYRWKYFSTINCMLVYFVPQLLEYKYSINQTLKTLWKSEFPLLAYQFLRQIIEVVNERPLLINISTLFDNICMFASENLSFISYSNLKTHLGPTVFENRYQLICFLVSLSLDYKKKSRSLLVEIAKGMNLLRSNLKRWAKQIYYPGYILFICHSNRCRNVRKILHINIKLSLYHGDKNINALFQDTKRIFFRSLSGKKKGHRLFVRLLEEKLKRRLREMIDDKRSYDPDKIYS